MAKQRKMPNRFMVLLAILLVLAIAVAGLVDPFGWLKPTPEEQEAQAGLNKLLCDFSADKVSAFEIKQSKDEAFTLAKEKDQWYAVQGAKRYRADPDRVQKLLDGVPGLRAESIATQSVEKRPTFEVDSAQGIALSVFTGAKDPAVKLIVGKADPSYQSCFVRVGDGKEVYRASANIKSLVAFSFRDYRSRKPCPLDEQTAQSVTVRAPVADSPALTFSKKDNFWKTPDGKNANQNLLNELVKKLGALTINDFADAPDEKEAGLSGLKPNVTVTTPEGTFSLTLGAEKDMQYFVRDQDGFTYRISEYNLKFYSDLDFTKLTFDDTAKAAAGPGKKPGEAGSNEPQEGVKNGLGSEAQPGKPAKPGKPGKTEIPAKPGKPPK
jgi:hypothetical protein